MNRKQRRAQIKTASAPQAVLPDLQKRLGSALQHHRAGRLAAAKDLYRKMLVMDPRFADALHLLGVAAQQEGRSAASVALIKWAIRTNPGIALFQSNLGNALSSLKRIGEAVSAYTAAISITPDFADAYQNLGISLRDAGRLAEAVASYRAAHRIRPDALETVGDVGNTLKVLGRGAEASNAYRAAICLGPTLADAYSNLGIILKEQGNHAQALAGYDRALSIRPDFAEAHYNRGIALKESGELACALTACRKAISLKPDYAEAYSNNGALLFDLGALNAAAAAYDVASRLKPGLPEAWSNLLLSLHYRPDFGEDRILREARRYGALLERDRPRPSFANTADPTHRLRIGYVSGDFRSHPVGYFVAPVLACHDRADVEVFCYTTNGLADRMTERLRSNAVHWRSLAGLSDDMAADLVAADHIDILVDLSGHTAGNRLSLFARRPAPLQISWLGFWGTTGLPAMDYILSDFATIPAGQEIHYSEKVLYLPGSRFCYAPPDYAPAPSLPPSLRGDGLTFGSFNNLIKMGPDVVRLWAEVLKAVPGSRLLLKWRTLSDGGVRRSLIEAFVSEGVSADRLDLRAASPHKEMLADYSDIDIALDPFPFSGGLTTCEALWMGVPVVTLPGSRAPSRQTLGFLQSLGLTEWAAASPEDYTRIAVELAADRERLGTLRHTLRDRMASSPLCDGASFTRNLEGIYRRIWSTWCETRPETSC